MALHPVLFDHVWTVSDPADTRRHTHQHWVLGEQNHVPFFLCYTEPGLTQWFCPETLDESLRRKILNKLRMDVRHKSTSAATVSTRAIALTDRWFYMQAFLKQHAPVALQDTLWRAFLWEQPTRTLNVPFAERHAAKALGARWNSDARVWDIPARIDPTPFQAWLEPSHGFGAPQHPQVPPSPITAQRPVLPSGTPTKAATSPKP